MMTYNQFDNEMKDREDEDFNALFERVIVEPTKREQPQEPRMSLVVNDVRGKV